MTRTLAELPYKEKDEILDWTCIPAGRCDMNFRPPSAHPTGDIREVVVWLVQAATIAGFFGLALRYLIGPFMTSWISLGLAVGIGTVLALVVVLRSPFGACVIGVRDSPGRMAALGYSPTAYRIAGVVVASTVAGMAGVLNAYVVRFVSPTEFAPLVSAKSLLFTVVGGSGMLGSVVAATVLTFLEDELSTRFDRWLTVLGLVYVAIAMIGERTARRALRPVGILVARTSGAVRRRPRSDASGHVPLVQTVEVEA